MNAPIFPPVSPELIDRFGAIVGPRYAVTDPAEVQPYLIEPRDTYVGRSPLVLRPGSVAEVAAIVKLANATGTPIVPQGGNTGMVGAQTPDTSGGEIVVALGRLNKIRATDPTGNTLTAEAGVTLLTVQEAAEAADRLFPLSLSSEGTCTIGGNLAANAGGTGVLAYGNTRDLVLGVEVVLPSGEVWNGLRTLRKDNTGYDLKHLFIGSEGTLGIITAAVLKLFPRPKGRSVAFAGLASPEDALRLFAIARSIAGAAITAFEFTIRFGLETVLRHAPGVRNPLAGMHEWYVLIEISSQLSDEDAATIMENVFVAALEEGVVEDVARAETIQQAKDFWNIRHGLSDIQKREGGSIRHDVSVPIGQVPAFLHAGIDLVTKMIPGCRPCPFGHLGDGNIHFNVSQPVGMDKEAYLGHLNQMHQAVHALTTSFGGSISAEHGIGQAKRGDLPGVKSPVEMALMRSIKATIDPKGILNPGKVL